MTETPPLPADVPASAPTPAAAPEPTTAPNPILRIGLAVLFLLPALLCCATQDVWPTISNFYMSLQKTNGLGGDAGGAQFVGMENYNRLFGGPFPAAVGFRGAIIFIRILAVSIVPLLVGLGLSALSERVRNGVRGVLAAPLALFVPVAMALAWLLITSPRGGLFPTAVFASPGGARLALLVIDGLATLGIGVAAGAWLYPLTAKSGLAARIAILSLLIIAAIASGLQTSVFSSTTTNGGPANSTTTLVLLMEQSILRNFQVGFGAALGTLILVVVMVLGLVATIILLATRVQLAPAEPVVETNSDRRPMGLLLLGIGGLVALVACLISALPLPWVALQSVALKPAGGVTQINTGVALFNTIAPAFISAFLIELPITWLAAFAIGGLRPLGKRSELMLLLFSPWLFITVAPLMAPLLLGLVDAKRVDQFTALLTPFALSVPLLLVLTLFFKVHTSRSPAPSFSQLMLRSLPLTLGGAAVLFFVHLNEFTWPYMVVRSPETLPLTMLLPRLAQTATKTQALASLIVLFWLPMAVVFFIVFGAWLALYGGRLEITTDR